MRTYAYSLLCVEKKCMELHTFLFLIAIICTVSVCHIQETTSNDESKCKDITCLAKN